MRLTIKVKVGIPESFKVGWYPHKITGLSHVNCRNKKGLLNFVSERINLVYSINNTRYNFQKNKLHVPFKHLKPQFIGRILLN